MKVIPRAGAWAMVGGMAAASCARHEGLPPAPDPTARASASAAASATSSVAASAAPIASHVPATIEGADLTQAHAVVDGLEVTALSCRTGGGPATATAILAALAEQRSKLAACVSAPVSVRVHFVFQAGKTGDWRVSGSPSPAAARCVAEALGAARFPGEGACALSIRLGAE